jgi:hypothetical protein
MFSTHRPNHRLNRLKSVEVSSVNPSLPQGGVLIGSDIYWNPGIVANPHGCIIGGSGAGKTQTLKSIAWGMIQSFGPQVIVIDFHGDQALPGEYCLDVNMTSDVGINPLRLNLDTEGGGPNLKSIELAALFKKTLRLGPNQEGLMIDVLKTCYQGKGIFQELPSTWTKITPNFSHIKDELESRIEKGDKEASKMILKLSAFFEYRIFSRSQPINQPLTRWNLSKLPPELQSIAADAIASQLMNDHRLSGEWRFDNPKTVLFIDEAKELTNSKALNRIAADGRKYGLAVWVASQRPSHIAGDVLSNTFTKIVLPVDSSDLAKTSKTFNFSADIIASLKPLEALVRFGRDAHRLNILPFYQRNTP